MVCIELAWPSPNIIDKTPCGWGTLFTTFSGTGLLEFVSLMGVVGTFARTCGCGFFMRIFWCGFFWCGFLGADFFRGFWGADFFADFVMACADFGVQIFSADFLGCFPAEIALTTNPIKKSHRKILTNDLVQETFLHNTPLRSFWQNTADLLRASGCRCTL